MQTDWKREILSSLAGALAGAILAQALGAREMIPTAAIAGAFVGPGIVAVVRRALAANRASRR
jgi:uncharacterized membrane protein YeaQ/YmgE (transglycosylase-associated protein family)